MFIVVTSVLCVVLLPFVYSGCFMFIVVTCCDAVLVWVSISTHVFLICARARACV
jgi:hypothetical protein